MTSLDYWLIDLEASQDEDLDHAWQWMASGVPVDLTGASLRMVVKKRDGTEIAEWTDENGNLPFRGDPALGTFGPLVLAADLAAISPGVYTHKCLVTLDGRTTRVWTGMLKIVGA